MQTLFPVVEEVDRHKQTRCVVEGCPRIRTSKGHDKRGQRTYSRYCWFHAKSGNRPGSAETTTYRPQALLLQNMICTVCGWQGPCDKHRLIPGKDGGAYVEGNVVVVCPNCHRLLHRGVPVEKLMRRYATQRGLGIGTNTTPPFPVNEAEYQTSLTAVLVEESA